MADLFLGRPRSRRYPTFNIGGTSPRHLRTAVTEYVVHYHTERNHQGLGNELLTPLPASANDTGPIVSRERLGGILNYYCRAA